MSQKQKSFFSNLSFLDFYAAPITVLLKREPSFSTPLGQAGSLCILILSLFVLALQTIDMYTLTNPNIVSKVVSNLNPEAYTLTPDNYFFGIGVGDTDGKPILNTDEKKFYTIEFFFAHSKDTIVDGAIQTDVEFVQIDTIPCLEASSNPDLIKVRNISLHKGQSQERLMYAQCLNPQIWKQKLQKAFLQGIGTSPTMSYITVSLQACDPLVFSNCAPADELAKMMNYGFIQFIFTDNLLDQSQAANPYNPTLKTTTTQFTKDSLTNVKNILRHSYFENIENFYYFLPASTTYHVLSLVQQVETIFKSDVRLAYVHFFLDDKSEYYTRTYSTFFDIFANVQGFSKFLTVIFGLALGPITKLYQNVSLINEVFDVSDGKNTAEEQRSLIRMSSNQLVFNINKCIQKGLFGSMRSDDGKDIRPEEKQLKRLLTQKNKKMRLRCYQIPILQCNKKQKSLIRQGTEKLEQQMDITNIINKLFEFEKLKHFLLDENQLKLFDYIPRPEIKEEIEYKSNTVIPLQRSKSSVEYFMKDQEFEKKVEQALAAYKLLRKSKNEADVRLIELMNQNIREIFELQIDDNGPNIKSDIHELIDEFQRQDIQSVERFSNLGSRRLTRFKDTIRGDD